MNVTKKDGNCSLDEVPIKAGEVVRINPNSVLHFGKMDISFEVKVQQQIQEGHGLEEGLGVGVDEHEHEHEPQKEEEKEEEKQKETTREERIAQINAMTASLDSEEPLSYTKFNSNTAPPSSSSSSSHSNNNNHNPQQSLQSLDIPVSHTATLSSHEKSVTTLDLDPKGEQKPLRYKQQPNQPTTNPPISSPSPLASRAQEVAWSLARKTSPSVSTTSMAWTVFAVISRR